MSVGLYGGHGDDDGQSLTTLHHDPEVPEERLAPYRRSRALPYAAGACVVVVLAGIAVAAYVASSRDHPHRPGGLPPSPPPAWSACETIAPLTGPTEATLETTIANASYLRFPVESREYRDQHPGLLFVSQRGGGGVSVLNMTRNESNPPMVARWLPTGGATPHHDSPANGTGRVPVEGQDLRNGVLAVCGVGRDTGLWLLNATDPGNLTDIAYVPNVTAPDGAGPLHVKLYVPTTAPHRMFALLSMGWFSWGTTTRGHYLLAIDVSDPAAPRVVTSVSTPAECMESVLVVRDTAYVGGFCATSYTGVRLTGLLDAQAPHMVVADTATATDFVQMVSALVPPPVPAAASGLPWCGFRNPIIVSGVWANPGGIAVFNASNAIVQDGNVSFVSRLTSPQGSFANRVHRTPAGLVLTPLEHGASESDHDGGFALYDIRVPAAPRLLLARRVPVATRVYCAALSPSGAYLYVFGADDNSMRVYSLR